MYGAIPGDIIGSPYGFDQGKSVSRIRFMGERRQNKSKPHAWVFLFVR